MTRLLKYICLPILMEFAFMPTQMIAQEEEPVDLQTVIRDTTEASILQDTQLKTKQTRQADMDTLNTRPAVRNNQERFSEKQPSEKINPKILLVRKGKLRQFFIMQPNQIFEMRVEKPEYVSITIDPNGNQVITIPKDIESNIFYTGLSITDTTDNEDDLGFEDKEVSISFSNNDQYMGRVKNGLPHGEGEIRFQNGDTYKGEFEMGKFDGKGTYYDLDSDITYQGSFKNGQRSGYGKLYNGEPQDSILIYEGEYLYDLFHGTGKYYTHGRLRYEGEFSHGEFEGKGTLYERGELIYKGHFLNGMMHGEGIKYVAQGVYEGRFKDDQFHGLGVFKFENGDTLSGTFREGEIYYGEFKYANLDHYKGELNKGIKHGKGFYTNNEGDTYYGTFQNGSLANGTCLFSDGSKYEGEMENWKFHGQGTYYFPDGSYVTGEFQHGKFCTGFEYKMKKNGKLKKKNKLIENC